MEGYGTGQVIEQLSERIIFSDDLTDKQKAIIGEKLGVSNVYLIKKLIIIINLSFILLFP